MDLTSHHSIFTTTETAQGEQDQKRNFGNEHKELNLVLWLHKKHFFSLYDHRFIAIGL